MQRLLLPAPSRTASFRTVRLVDMNANTLETLPGGWLVATNLNNILKRTIIEPAAEVAGLTFGKDVVVEF